MSEQTSAAQSAPAGEREAFDKWFRAEQLIADHIDTTFISSAFLPYKAFQAGASWQRTQSAGVPEGWRLVPEVPNEAIRDAIDLLCDDASAFDDSEAFWHYLLAAAPAQPAAHDQGDQQEDLHVWCATSLLGYTCHFGEASAARAWAGENGTIERVDLTPVPDLQVVKRQDQGEVQRLRDWVACVERLPADKRDVMVYCADSDEHMVGSSIGDGLFLFATASNGEKVVCRPTHWRYIDESDKPDLAASTGQEVGK